MRAVVPSPLATAITCALVVAGLAAACKNSIKDEGGAPGDPRAGAAPEVSPTQAGLAVSTPVGTIPAPLDDGMNGSSFASARQAADTVCSEPKGSSRRKAALDAIAAYAIGTAVWDLQQAAAGADACVKALRLPALVTSLASGVPVGTLIGQAVQETGFCKSDLARQALNFHGMKAHVSASDFTYWTGEKFRKASTESTTGAGNLQVSDFMKFRHVDHGFWSLAERLVIPSLPYVSCFGGRAQVDTFMRCIGKSWAVHTTYAEVVLGHRQKYGLAACELAPGEWRLKGKWQGR